MLDKKKNKLSIIGQEHASTSDVKESGVSRRDFLKILGASSAVGLASCADPAGQNIFPYAKGEPEQVPGVAVWYNTTCTECEAGCGISVRTREGRAVKVEGNNEHPINRGGLCALGQSAVQNLYDPDRVRQPLEKKNVNGKDIHVPISWDAALAKVSNALKNSKGKNGLLTGALSGSMQNFVQTFAEELNLETCVYEPLAPVQAAKAANLVFGIDAIPAYKFDQAEVLLNFGADFLETWISPCEYARDWAKSRKSEQPLRGIHIEPRLSLTAASADSWVMNSVGSELEIALAIAKLLLQKGKNKALDASATSALKKVTADIDVYAVAKKANVKSDKLLDIAQRLANAKSSLVIAGGTAASASNGLALCVVVNLINLMLGNVGKTIVLEQQRKVQTDFTKLDKFLTALNSDKSFDILFVAGANPEFTLPTSYGFKYARRKAGMLVSFASQLDETAKVADLILPVHTSLEAWGDSQAVSGIRSLQQPVMSPVFSTKHFGDLLIAIAKTNGSTKIGGYTDYLAYLQERWTVVHKDSGSSDTFRNFWRKSVEQGGYFPKNSASKIEIKTSSKAFDLDFAGLTIEKSAGKSGLTFYPYASVKSFDGRAANRPWLQEVPDPLTSVVWDTWLEINPETATKHGLKHGDSAALTNKYGQLNIPVYVTKHVAPNVLAVPLGNGHTEYGRYAQMVQGGNAFDLLPAVAANYSAIGLLSAEVDLQRGRRAVELVQTQIADEQGKRHIAQIENLSAKTLHQDHSAHSNTHNNPMKVEHVNKDDNGSEHHGSGHHDSGHDTAHHAPKQVYDQRISPLYHWVMVVDLAACTGCQACVVACSAENNIPVVGKNVASQGREMSWLRIERYVDTPGSADNQSEELVVNFLPMMCQHCQNAPCEPVCPVYATYHNEEGLNAMVYNRCVGTRYCGNNCSYKVRRYNWFEFNWPEPLTWQLNPDVTKRAAGVMEKCTFCVQRIKEGQNKAKDIGRLVQDGEVKPACVQSCPTQALSFGNFNDHDSEVYKLSKSERAYKVLDHHLNTQPSVIYLKNRRYMA
jgi:anaerobic selenocysteine-containing dehydrogenase/Fe-S-cluster-containing dehydrogenase component